MGVMKIGCGVIRLAPDNDQWRYLVNTTLNRHFGFHKMRRISCPREQIVALQKNSTWREAVTS